MYTGFLWDEVCILDAVKNTDVLWTAVLKKI